MDQFEPPSRPSPPQKRGEKGNTPSARLRKKEGEFPFGTVKLYPGHTAVFPSLFRHAYDLNMAPELTNLEQLLDQMATAARGREEVSLGALVEAVGSRSFGPLLLLVGVVLASPLSGVPGMATTMAVLVMSIAVQLLFGRKHFWMPRWLLNRSVSRDRFIRALDWLHPPARWIDRWLRPRLTVLVHRSGAYAIAIICTVIAVGMPAMELVPFSASSAGVALAAFGLSLVAHDGLLALIAFAFTAGTFGLVVYHLI